MVTVLRAFRRVISHRRYRRLFSLITLASVLALGALTVTTESPSAPMSAPTYYYVANDGDDPNPGTSPDRPWRTLAPVHAHAFQPGDIIHLKRGSSWDSGLVIDDSGIEGNPITFTAYGEGDRPLISNSTGGQWTHVVDIYGSWIVIEGLLVRDAHEGGVNIREGANYNVVRDIEATNVGQGVRVKGQYNLITRNYLHDPNMVVNTPGGDDDHGAVGVFLSSSDNEVSYNRMENCKAPSHDYGVDGGAVEWYGNADRNYVHHNWATGCDGFLEVGGGSAVDNIVAYNVSINNGRFSWMHLSGANASDVQNFRLENNTIVEIANEDWGWVTIGFGGAPNSNTLLMRNNIMYLERYRFPFNESSFTHEVNLYYFIPERPPSDWGFTLGEGEMVVDPLLVDLGADDLHLQPDSPAIDAGLDLGYTLDHEDYPVPVGNAPDTGSYEYRSGPQPTATSTLTATPTPTLTPTPTPTLTPTATPNPNELIVDNTDGGFSASFFQDHWAEYVDTGGQHYGESHHYNRQIGTGQDTASWSFTVLRPGTYNVYAWWWEANWRPTDVPYTVNHLSGSTTVRVNQQTAGGQWNLLGAFGFQHQGSVTVSDDASSGRDVVADAVRLVYLGPTPPGSTYRVFLPVVRQQAN